MTAIPIGRDRWLSGLAGRRLLFDPSPWSPVEIRRPGGGQVGGVPAELGAEGTVRRGRRPPAVRAAPGGTRAGDSLPAGAPPVPAAGLAAGHAPRLREADKRLTGLCTG